MKKYLSLILIAIAMTSVCSGCTEYDEVKSEEVSVLKIIKPNNIPDFSEIVASFNEANTDIQVTFVDAPSSTDERHNFYVSALSGKDKTIDIYWMNDAWIEEFAQKNYLIPIEDDITIDNSRYIVDAEKQFSYNDSLYALPVGTDMDAIFYRSDKISELPDNWNGIIDLCRRSDFGVSRNLGLEQFDTVDMINDIVQIKESMGYSYADTLNLYKDIIKEYSGEGTDILDSITLFKTGNTAIYMGKISLWNEFRSDTSSVKDSVNVAMLPASPDGSPVNNIRSYGLAINSNSENKEEAIKFLDFMNSKAQQRSLARETSVMPIIEELFSDDMVLEEMSYMEKTKEIIKNSVVSNSNSISGEDLKTLGNALTKFFNNEETANNTGEILNDLLG